MPAGHHSRSLSTTGSCARGGRAGRQIRGAGHLAKAGQRCRAWAGRERGEAEGCPLSCLTISGACMARAGARPLSSSSSPFTLAQMYYTIAYIHSISLRSWYQNLHPHNVQASL